MSPNATSVPGPRCCLRERERVGLARRRVVRVVDEASAGDVDGLGPVAADHERVAAAERGEVVEEAGQDGPALDLEHGLGRPRREPAEAAALSRRQHHRRERLAGRQVAALGLLQLGVSLQTKHLVKGGHLRLDGQERFVRADATRRLLHGADGRPQQMVRPDHHADLARPEVLGRGAPVLGGDEHHRRPPVPFREEREDLGRARLARVDQDRVGARRLIGLGALEGFRESPARDQRLHARHQHEVRIRLAVLAGLDLAAELVDVGERLQLRPEERVRLGEELVLDDDAGDADLLELPDEPAHAVEVAVAGVAVEEDGNVDGLGHERDVVHHLRPAQLVVVPDAKGGRDGQAARPDPFEAGLLRRCARRARRAPPSGRRSRAASRAGGGASFFARYPGRPLRRRPAPPGSTRRPPRPSPCRPA